MKSPNLTKIVKKAMTLMLVGSITFTAFVRQAQAFNYVNFQEQKQEEKTSDLTGLSVPIYYKKAPLLDENNKEAKDQNGNVIYTDQISQRGEDMYLLSMNYVYKVIIRDNDRLHYWMQNERWFEDKHNKDALIPYVLRALNGKDFDPARINLGDEVYLVDFDRNGVINLNSILSTKISNWDQIKSWDLSIEGEDIYLMVGPDQKQEEKQPQNKVFITKTRGERLSPEEAYSIIEFHRKTEKDTAQSIY